MIKQLAELANLVGGTCLGDPDLQCTGANPPEEAQSGDLTLLDDASKATSILDSGASVIVTSSPIESEAFAQIIVDDPREAFAKIVACFRPPIQTALPRVGIDPTATIAGSALIHPSATIGSGVVIGQRTMVMPGVVVMPETIVGDDCVLHANVTLYEYTQIGNRVTIHAGSVIGANGFGYRQEGGRHLPSPQLGYVAIEEDVEIGASVTIDRGTFGATRIGQGTKIDNLVMVAHNCQIGRHNLICSQVGIAGSCRTGDHVILAGQVGLKDHITLGDRAIVGAQAGVMDDCEGDQVYLGSPATPQRDQMQIMAVERRLPEMRKELKQLRRELDQLRSRQDDQEQRAA